MHRIVLTPIGQPLRRGVDEPAPIGLPVETPTPVPVPA